VEEVIALIVTVVTSVLEIIDQLVGSELTGHAQAIEVGLAVITPLLVWLLPKVQWVRDFPE
jgi:hypothetical protein